MVKVYLPPPAVTEILESFARWVAGIYRVKIEITIAYKDGDYHTCTVDRRDET